MATLLKRRERLLADVRKKRSALSAASERAEAAAQKIDERMALIVPRFKALREEVAALFDELLAPGRLAMRTRSKVFQVYRALIVQGLIPEPSHETSEDADGEDDDASFGDEFDIGPPPFSAQADPEARVAAAPQHGQAVGRDSLRTLFRRLALAVHPDRAQHDHDRARRTEAMKEATRAYEEGDLARLLELQKAWQHGAGIAVGPEDDGRRCEELEQTIRELNRQSRELSRDLRELKKRASADMLDLPTEDVVAMAERELEDLADIRDFVKGFRDGKITLARFMQGPALGNEEDAMSELAEMIGQILQEQAPRRSRGRPARRRG